MADRPDAPAPPGEGRACTNCGSTDIAVCGYLFDGGRSDCCRRCGKPMPSIAYQDESADPTPRPEPQADGPASAVEAMAEALYSVDEPRAEPWAKIILSAEPWLEYRVQTYRDRAAAILASLSGQGDGAASSLDTIFRDLIEAGYDAGRRENRDDIPAALAEAERKLSGAPGARGLAGTVREAAQAVVNIVRNTHRFPGQTPYVPDELIDRLENALSGEGAAEDGSATGETRQAAEGGTTDPFSAYPWFFRWGQPVAKVTGYRGPGVIRGFVLKGDGSPLYAVEHRIEGGDAFQHLYGPANIEAASPLASAAGEAGRGA